LQPAQGRKKATGVRKKEKGRPSALGDQKGKNNQKRKGTGGFSLLISGLVCRTKKIVDHALSKTGGNTHPIKKND